MLNLDMVGRANGAVDVSGLEVAPSMEADFATASKRSGTDAQDQARKGPAPGAATTTTSSSARMPAINFFTGFHPDYHRPG